ncbi:hypothetical protein [Corynebacterium sp. 13CS0277]|uniref:hypothetical protein n=1 Tax=Corynebacterium sp. 13CS0277 TaxID=2071994 RepID=UPI0011B27149|nr:hypothetical protein [Corynebacterium sp. 13CS0277]
MRNITELSTHFPRRRTEAAHTPMSLAERTQVVERNHRDTLSALESIIAHPRALTRDSLHWRAPQKKLPAAGDCPPLIVTLQRTRLGDLARQSIRHFGEERDAAFLITARFTSPTGQPVAPQWAHTWVRALLGGAASFDIHELLDASAPTLCWVTDRRLEPLRSPGALFDRASAA